MLGAARTAVDLFAGAGGTTQGLRDAGYDVVGAIESDAAAAKTYRANHADTKLDPRDIRAIRAPAFARRVATDGARLDVLTACPPCQGFSTLGSGDTDDARNDLVGAVARFTRALKPRVVLLENVPGLASDHRLEQLEKTLRRDYLLRRYVIDAADFGVPQHRRRIIIIAVEQPFASGPMPNDLRSLLPTGFDVGRRAAGPIIATAGAIGRSDDPLHRARHSKPLTLRRIRAMRVGGGRLDLPADLTLACHERLTGRHATSIYGRIDPKKPAPTMTTRCTTPSCGRFVHPVEDRGLSLREAALIQTFPPDYAFHGTYGEIERQIGNAVPVRLAHALGLVAEAFLDGGDAQSPATS